MLVIAIIFLLLLIGLSIRYKSISATSLFLAGMFLYIFLYINDPPGLRYDGIVFQLVNTLVTLPICLVGLFVLFIKVFGTKKVSK